MSEIKIIGIDTDDDTATIAGNYLVMQKHTAEETGTLVKIKIKCSGTRATKVGVYSDNAGEPDALLTSSSFTSVAGWNEVTVTGCSIQDGVSYWLAFNSDFTNVRVDGLTTKTRRFKSLTFANDFPNPAGSGFNTSNGPNHFIGGYAVVGSIWNNTSKPTTNWGNRTKPTTIWTPIERTSNTEIK